jgi:polyhydroxyalkanoate synthase
MCRAAHSWYLRNTYVENNLIKPGKVTLKGEPIDLGRVDLDIYAVGAKKDHIVPWDAAWRITQIVKGDVRYVLASSGHIAGIINPPGSKRVYWTNEAGNQASTPKTVPFPPLQPDQLPCFDMLPKNSPAPKPWTASEKPGSVFIWS